MYCQLLEYLDKKNIPWELFINGMRKDYLFGRKVLEKYGNQDIEIVCPSSAIEAVKKISSYKVILGARLHACICAYSLDIPLAGINWDEKLKHFSEIAKIEDLFFSEKTIKNNSLGEKLVYLYENGYSYDKEIRNYWKNQTGSSLCAFVSEMK